MESTWNANVSSGSNQRGHLGLPDDGVRRSTIAVLDEIYRALGGDLQTLASGRTTPLPVHPSTPTREHSSKSMSPDTSHRFD